MTAMVNPGYVYASILIAGLWAVLGKRGRWFPGQLERVLAVSMAFGLFIVAMILLAEMCPGVGNVGVLP